MLNFMRKHTKIIMFIVILFFVLSCFAGYGLYTRGRGGGEGMRDYAVAEFGKKTVMRSQLERMAQQIASQYGNTASLDAAEVRKAALDSIVLEGELENEIAKRGIEASKEEIDSEYKKTMDSYPTREEFTEYMKRSGLTEAQVKDGIKENIRMRKFFESLEKDIKTDDKEVRAFYDSTKLFFFTQPAGFKVNLATFTDKAAAEEARREIAAGSSWDSVIEKHRAALEMATSYDHPTFIPDQMAEKELKALKDAPLNKITAVEPAGPNHSYIAIKRSIEKERVVPFNEVSADAAAALRNQKMRQVQDDLFRKLVQSADVKILDDSIFPKAEAPAAEPASGDGKTE